MPNARLVTADKIGNGTRPSPFRRPVQEGYVNRILLVDHEPHLPAGLRRMPEIESARLLVEVSPRADERKDRLT